MSKDSRTKRIRPEGRPCGTVGTVVIRNCFPPRIPSMTSPNDPPARSGWSWRRAWITGVALMLFAIGTVLAVVAVTSQEHAPQPPASAAGTLGSSTTSSRPAAVAPGSTFQGPEGNRQPATTTTTVSAMAKSEPTAIEIPAIGVRSTLNQVGLNPDGTLEVPRGDRYDQAAWYRGSPTPGSIGPSVIEGHIDSASQGPSVFFRLGDLRPGDEVTVRRADSAVAVFTVTAVRSYSKAAFPTTTVYANTDRPALRLITCGGAFDRSSGHYLNNTVVFATLDH